MMCWQTLALWNVRPGPSALHLMRLCRADDTRVPLLDQKAPERIHHGVSALCFVQRSGANMFQSRAERSGGPRGRDDENHAWAHGGWLGRKASPVVVLLLPTPPPVPCSCMQLIHWWPATLPAPPSHPIRACLP